MDRHAWTISSISLLVLFSAAAASPLTIPSAEISISKSYSGSQITPAVNEYVEYDLTIKNSSAVPILNQSLWVNFASTGGRTNVSTSFLVGDLSTGESKIIHLGPFKMREAGQHILLFGINNRASPMLPNEILTSAEADKPIDTFTVYEPMTINLVVIGIICLASGLGILFALSRFKRNRMK